MMIKDIKHNLLILMGLSLTFLTGCDATDLNYDQATPPVVTFCNSIQGQVIDFEGKGLKAAVSINDSTQQTDSDGYFSFNQLAAGNYTLKVTSEGKRSTEKDITLESGITVHALETILLSNSSVKLQANANGSFSHTLIPESSTNHPEASIRLHLNGKEHTLPSSATFTHTFLYAMDDETINEKEAMLIGSSLKPSNPSDKLHQPVRMEYEIDPVIIPYVYVKEQKGNSWEMIPVQKGSDKITFTIDHFSSYAVFLQADFHSVSDSTENITFTPELWDNMYGKDEIFVKEGQYTCKTGGEITTETNNIKTAYLNEILAHRLGSKTHKSHNYTFPINVTLPRGTGMTPSGYQKFNRYILYGFHESATGKAYGYLTLTAQTWDRIGTGGSGGSQW